LALSANENTRRIWPFDFELRFTIDISSALTMTLAVKNAGTEPIKFDDALHTYYTVGDVREIAVHGLHNAQYLDKTKGMQRATETARNIRIAETVDRVYVDTAATCTIEDPSLRRRIIISKQGSRT